MYSCTQDDEQCSLRNFRTLNVSFERARLTRYKADSGECSSQGLPDKSVCLNPWVEKAIKEGQYTTKQVAMLRAQRQKVIDSIAAAEEQFKQVPSGDPVSPSQVQQSASSPSVDANPHLPYPVITEVEEFDKTEGSQTRLEVFPHCRFRSCHACRPTYRDRAWPALEQIFAADFRTFVEYCGEARRRVSDAKVVRKIGLDKPRPARPPLRSLDSLGLYSTTSCGNILLASSQSKRSISTMNFSMDTDTVDISDAKTDAESRGFRDSIKRAFRNMLSSRRRDSTPSADSSKSPYKMRPGEEEDNDVEFDMDLWCHLNDELLQNASGVPLPGHDGMDGLDHEEGEIEVKDGVAVTEEGVDLGTADIIMSV